MSVLAKALNPCIAKRMVARVRATQLNIRVREDEYEQIRSVAEKRGETISDTLRHLAASEHARLERAEAKR